MSLIAQKQQDQLDKLAEIKEQQANGTQAMMTGNVDASYEFPAMEKGSVHVKLSRYVDNGGRVKDEQSMVQTYSVQGIKALEEPGFVKQVLNYDDMQYLHDPRRKSAEVQSEEVAEVTEVVKKKGGK